MQVSKISNNQQNFNGANFNTAKAYHTAKKKAFYGIAAGCALLTSVCSFSYAKNANPDGYRSNSRVEKSLSAKEFFQITASLAGLFGGLFSLKKAEEEKEAEELCDVKENIKKKKEEKVRYFEDDVIEELESVDKPEPKTHKTKYFINKKNFKY